KVIDWKIPLLLSAYERFEHNAPAHEREAFASFCHTNDARWLDEYAFFVALKNFYDKKAWY
ncbi:MAG: 4-alpha-glucanotransferase, partial [Calditrichaeota bacterium]|nr:4-alpha-glucanotransferase [Calditrichota bacterium]